jgi:hypothetical protein
LQDHRTSPGFRLPLYGSRVPRTYRAPNGRKRNGRQEPHATSVTKLRGGRRGVDEISEEKRGERPSLGQSWTGERVETGPLEHDSRFVADDPAVVPRGDVGDIAGPELKRRSVLETDPGATGEHDANVTRLTPFSSNGWAHMLGPTPAWLVDDVPDREVPELGDFRPEQWKLDRLIRRREVLQAEVDHLAT